MLISHILIKIKSIIIALNIYYLIFIEFIEHNLFLFRKLLKPKQKNANKKGKKTKDKKNVSLESTNASNFNMTNLVEDENDDHILENEVDISIYHDYFRELDIDTWLILTQKFVVNPDPEHVS